MSLSCLSYFPLCILGHGTVDACLLTGVSATNLLEDGHGFSGRNRRVCDSIAPPTAENLPFPNVLRTSVANTMAILHNCASAAKPKCAKESRSPLYVAADRTSVTGTEAEASIDFTRTHVAYVSV